MYLCEYKIQHHFHNKYIYMSFSILITIFKREKYEIQYEFI